ATLARVNPARRPPTLRFLVADAMSLPLADDASHVVVTFETLEHFRDHSAFIDEVARILRPNGLLLLSTPDRSQYLRDAEPNPYHVREVDRDELRSLLTRRFTFSVIGGQRSDPASLITFSSSSPGAPPNYFDRLDETRFSSDRELSKPLYLIAVATNGEPPKLGFSALLDSDYLPDLHARYHRALTDVWTEAKVRTEEATALQQQ